MQKLKHKDSVVLVYTGEGKGKTSASLGLLTRALGAGWHVSFVQFIKLWDVSEHQFIRDIMPIYEKRLVFYKGGLGFYDAGELSAPAKPSEHRAQAKKTFDFALKCVSSGEYDLVICDEINNAIGDGLLPKNSYEKLLSARHEKTSLCLTGRNFPSELLSKVDIATNMTKLNHHFDDGFIANKGIDY